MEDRLVDVAQADSEFGEGVENFLCDPACVPDFDDQRKLSEPRLQAPQVFAVWNLFLNDQGNWIRTAPKRPASIRGVMPALKSRSSSGLGFLSWVNE